MREDGTRREVLRVTPATTPQSVAIIIDNSQAVAPAIADLRKALTTFLTTIDGIGPVAISRSQTARRSSKITRPTRSHSRTRPTGCSMCQAAVHAAGRHRGGRQRRRATRVGSCGHPRRRDREHRVQPSAVPGRVEGPLGQRRDDARGRAGQPAGSFLTDEARNRATVLDRGPRESGGMRMDVLTSMSFEPRLKDLGGMLKNQYRVVYARPESLIPPEKSRSLLWKAGTRGSRRARAGTGHTMKHSTQH